MKFQCSIRFPEMLPIRNTSYLLPICCSFWEKCKNSPKAGLGCSTPLNLTIWRRPISVCVGNAVSIRIEMHRSFRGLRPLDPHQGLCPWTPPGPLGGPLDPTPQGSRALRSSIFCTLRKRLISGAPSHPLPTGTLEQSYATAYKKTFV